MRSGELVRDAVPRTSGSFRWQKVANAGTKADAFQVDPSPHRAKFE